MFCLPLEPSPEGDANMPDTLTSENTSPDPALLINSSYHPLPECNDQARILIQAHRKFHQIFKNMAFRQSENAIIEQLTQAIEALFPDRIASVLLMSQATGRLPPSPARTLLPDTYINSINGTPINPAMGSCGAAAYYKKPFIVADIQSHPNWKAILPIALKAGIRASWSMPILSHDEKVLGTFAIYCPTASEPSPYELEILETATHIASVVLDKSELMRAACTDPLTGLHNRNHFEGALEHLIGLACRNQHDCALVFADLNNFKQVNDNLGHDTGDQVLKKVAGALRNGLRKTDILCRYGGDEFIFAAVDINKTGVISVCQRIRNDLNHGISPQLKKLGFGISLGALLFTPDTNSSSEQLIQRSDQLMYQAKSHPENLIISHINQL